MNSSWWPDELSKLSSKSFSSIDSVHSTLPDHPHVVIASLSLSLKHAYEELAKAKREMKSVTGEKDIFERRVDEYQTRLGLEESEFHVKLRRANDQTRKVEDALKQSEERKKKLLFDLTQSHAELESMEEKRNLLKRQKMTLISRNFKVLMYQSIARYFDAWYAFLIQERRQKILTQKFRRRFHQHEASRFFHLWTEWVARKRTLHELSYRRIYECAQELKWEAIRFWRRAVEKEKDVLTIALLIFKRFSHRTTQVVFDKWLYKTKAFNEHRAYTDHVIGRLLNKYEHKLSDWFNVWKTFTRRRMVIRLICRRCQHNFFYRNVAVAFDTLKWHITKKREATFRVNKLISRWQRINLIKSFTAWKSHTNQESKAEMSISSLLKRWKMFRIKTAFWHWRNSQKQNRFLRRVISIWLHKVVRGQMIRGMKQWILFTREKSDRLAVFEQLLRRAYSRRIRSSLWLWHENAYDLLRRYEELKAKLHQLANKLEHAAFVAWKTIARTRGRSRNIIVRAMRRWERAKERTAFSHWLVHSIEIKMNKSKVEMRDKLRCYLSHRHNFQVERKSLLRWRLYVQANIQIRLGIEKVEDILHFHDLRSAMHIWQTVATSRGRLKTLFHSIIRRWQYFNMNAAWNNLTAYIAARLAFMKKSEKILQMWKLHRERTAFQRLKSHCNIVIRQCNALHWCVAHMTSRLLSRSFITWKDICIERDNFLANVSSAAYIVETLLRAARISDLQRGFLQLKAVAMMRFQAGRVMSHVLHAWYHNHIESGFRCWKKMYEFQAFTLANNNQQDRIVRSLREQLAHSQETILQLQTDKAELERRLRYASEAVVQTRLHEKANQFAIKNEIMQDGLDNYKKALQASEQREQELVNQIKDSRRQAKLEIREIMNELRQQKIRSKKIIEENVCATRRAKVEAENIRRSVGVYLFAMDAEKKRKLLYEEDHTDQEDVNAGIGNNPAISTNAQAAVHEAAAKFLRLTTK
eukprot:g1680.t1